MMLLWIIVILLVLIWNVELRLRDVRHKIDEEIAKGSNITLGVMGAGNIQDYTELLKYATLHPGRVCISVKRGQMSAEEIMLISKQVPRVWIAAKYARDRHHELELATRVKEMGGRVGLTIAAYNRDAELLMKKALNEDISIRIVKGYYSGDLMDQRQIDNMFLRLAKNLIQHANETGQTHLIATHDADIISKLSTMLIPQTIHLAQYWNRDVTSPVPEGVQVDIYTSTGRIGKTFLTELWWVKKPFASIKV